MNKIVLECCPENRLKRNGEKIQREDGWNKETWKKICVEWLLGVVAEVPKPFVSKYSKGLLNEINIKNSRSSI